MLASIEKFGKMETRLKGYGLSPFLCSGRLFPLPGWASAPFNLRQGTYSLFVGAVHHLLYEK
jgi:hypothetical protein